ncbi:MAG: 4Fe-4S dicluster domain-containing protein [Phycisphaerales bacterium]|nr:MAG: 4Fe-4S dicluster domain-containing protein [Phycisphaerales bacterium]
MSYDSTDNRQLEAFRSSWGNLTRITTIRILAQCVFFGLFLAFVLLTTFANLDRYPGLRLWVGKFLEIDPLIALATAVTTHTVYKGLLWSLIILIPTLFLGRFFCNWICPYGSMHHFVGWLFRNQQTTETIAANQYKRSQHIKYYILTAMLAATVFGSLQIGLLDPICLAYRSFTGTVLPTVSMPVQNVAGDYRLYQSAWLIGFLLFGLLAMNLVIPRFFCRVLCPLGALLGLLSRFAWWRIERDPAKCVGCHRCLLHCEGACDPHTRVREAECLVCFNCIEDCPENALSYAFLPTRDHEVVGTDTPRRKLIFAAVTGVLFYPFVRTAGRSTRAFSSKLIRPPGALEELKFLERCVKCDQCARVCPTNVIQPTWFEGGLEGLWSPILDFQMGHCQLHCTACGHVCPTGAIQRISIDRKLGSGEHADQGPIRLGTAHIDPGRCLPHSKNIPCVVCEEVCPTSPKAVYAARGLHTVRDGGRRILTATSNTVTVDTQPGDDDAAVQSTEQSPLPWKGSKTAQYYLTIRHDDGLIETHRITDVNANTLTIDGEFAQQPRPDSPATLQIELSVPRIDIDRCIGCGICEHKCPVIGDRPAIYVSPEGETRSKHCPHPDRNRSLRLDTDY